MNTVLLGVCTGSVAVSSALKVALRHHETVRPGVEPALVSLAGNYHGTDFLTQRMRGMWKAYFCGIRFVEVEPNDVAGLRNAFAAHRGHVAAMFAEPILMNREAIPLDPGFLGEARALCDEADACLVIDEIQTGFWYPDLFLYHHYGILPDILVVGKGMTAGAQSGIYIMSARVGIKDLGNFMVKYCFMRPGLDQRVRGHAIHLQG